MENQKCVYEYIPEVELEMAGGVWPRCDKLWKPVVPRAMEMRYSHAIPDIRKGYPVILSCHSGWVFGDITSVVVRMITDRPHCPICGRAIMTDDDGADSDFLAAKICTDCKRKEMAAQKSEGKYIVNVPDLDWWLPESCLSEVTAYYYDRMDPAIYTTCCASKDYIMAACQYAGTPDAAVAIALYRQAGRQKVPSLRTATAIEELQSNYNDTVLYHGAHYILFAGTGNLQLMYGDNHGDMVSAITQTIRGDDDVVRRFRPIAQCVADFYRLTECMTAEEMLETLSQMVQPSGDAPYCYM